MTTKTGKRRTTMVPVTTMEELPVLDDKERAELVASLKDSEAKIKSGNFGEYQPKTFKQRLLRIYRDKKR